MSSTPKQSMKKQTWCECKNNRGTVTDWGKEPKCLECNLPIQKDKKQIWEEPNKPYGIIPAPNTCCPEMKKEVICRGCDKNYGHFDSLLSDHDRELVEGLEMMKTKRQHGEHYPGSAEICCACEREAGILSAQEFIKKGSRI